jgi:hypothetical protein
MTAGEEWLHYATSELEGSDDLHTRTDLPADKMLSVSIEWLWPGMGRFQTENIWCPYWESRFPNRPSCSLFSTPTDAILDLPLSIMYLNSCISAYTTNFNAATCSIGRWEDGIRNDMKKIKITNWTSYIQDRNKWKLYIEKAKMFKNWRCSAWRRPVVYVVWLLSYVYDNPVEGLSVT